MDVSARGEYVWNQGWILVFEVKLRAAQDEDGDWQAGYLSQEQEQVTICDCFADRSDRFLALCSLETTLFSTLPLPGHEATSHVTCVRSGESQLDLSNRALLSKSTQAHIKFTLLS